MTKSYEHWRCQLCGKVSRSRNFQMGTSTGHALEMLTQEFVGCGRGGFRWTRRLMPRPYIEKMVEMLRLVLARLERELGVVAPERVEWFGAGASERLEFSERLEAGERVEQVERPGQKERFTCRVR